MIENKLCTCSYSILNDENGNYDINCCVMCKEQFKSYCDKDSRFFCGQECEIRYAKFQEDRLNNIRDAESQEDRLNNIRDKLMDSMIVHSGIDILSIFSCLLLSWFK